MAILTRVTGKVFGSTAPADEIGQFGSALAGSPLNTSDIATIQSLPAYTNGWGSAVVSNDNFPPMEEVTGVLKTISYQACYLLQAGVPIYDANTEYAVGDIVRVSNGQQLDFYISIKGSNSLVNPEANIGKWGNTDFWVRATILGDREIGVPQITLNYTQQLPDNCIDLNGAAISRTGDYATLFSIYGTTYGAGDGSTTFNLPNFNDYYLCGGTTGGYISAGLPDLQLSTSQNGAHTHTMNAVAGHTHGGNTLDASGALQVVSVAAAGVFKTDSIIEGDAFDHSGSGGWGQGKRITFSTKNKWTGTTTTAGAHTPSMQSNGAHEHTIISSNSLVGATNTVKTNGIKLRVFTRYK